MANNNGAPPAMPARTDKNFGSTNPYAQPPQQYNAAAPQYYGQPQQQGPPPAYPGANPQSGMYLDPGHSAGAPPPGYAPPLAAAGAPPAYPGLAPPGSYPPPPNNNAGYPGMAPPPGQPPAYPGLQPPGKVEPIPGTTNVHVTVVTQTHGGAIPHEGVPGTVIVNIVRSSSFGALQPLHLTVNGRRTPGLMAYESCRIFNVPPGRIVVRATHGSAGDCIVDAAPNQVLYFDAYTQMAGLGAAHHVKLKDEGWFFSQTKGNRSGKDFNSLKSEHQSSSDKAAKKAEKKAKKEAKKAAKSGK